MISEKVVNPAISATIDRLIESLARGIDTVLVCPRGCGSSTVGHLITSTLAGQGIPVVTMDLRAVRPWQEGYRQLYQAEDKMKRTGRNAALLIDHCEDIEPNEIEALYQKCTIDAHDKFHARLWIGNLDCHCPEVEKALPLMRDPRVVVLMPECQRDDLLRIYPLIGREQECEWGEAILYFIHDWCGSDLALVQGISTYLYGEWLDRLHDEAVAKCLDRWLVADPIVDAYRNTLRQMEGTVRDYVNLLCLGGKLPCHAPTIEQETDSTLRWLFFSGFVTPNLVPGYYRFRNLTVTLLAMQEHLAAEIESAILLRTSSNNRINVLLQDAELSLRLLLTRCFREMGFEAVKETLKKIKTSQLSRTREWSDSLSDWVQRTDDIDFYKKLRKHLAGFIRDLTQTNNLWTSVCDLHSKDNGDDGEATQEPSLDEIVMYLTLNELSNLIQTLCPKVFGNWKKEIPDRQSPTRRWPAYLARLGRLRNRVAHLKNVSFQDMEDLLNMIREMRQDIKDYV